MTNSHPRMDRERKTVTAMIAIRCRGQHGTRNGLCEECQALQVYALKRLQRCPFQAGKTTCAKCPVHCYQPDMRERIRAVMRYAGPRMLVWHPVLSLQHMIDGFRKEPALSARTEPTSGDLTRDANTWRSGNRG